jgi:syntaxin 6
MNTRQALKEQDSHIDDLVEITGQLHKYAHDMNQEISKQAEIAEDMDEQMDKTTAKLNFVQKRLSVLLKTSDRGQLCTIMILTGLLFVLVFFVIYL